MLWTAELDPSGPCSTRQAVLLTEAFEDSGLRIAAVVERQIALRIASLGAAELSALSPLPGAIAGVNATHLLGAGYLMTEFLIAPVFACGREHSRICSLGGLANLMVVVCDRSLDGGFPVEMILPPAELKTGGDSSPVTMLLREYSERFRDFAREEGTVAKVQRVTQRMFEAEIATIRYGRALPFRYWLRKCALPFVLMASPAMDVGLLGFNSAYLRFVYEIGRVFGTIDDGVDFFADLANGHPNVWAGKPEPLWSETARRVAVRANQILNFWDNVVPESYTTAVIRATFLYNVWRWLRPLSRSC